jgi:Cdc6-like AAA superfamily ATPase
MDSLKNPFSPGAGAPPPELVGREDVMQEAVTLLGRVKRGKAEKSMLMVGLRGVGKTVLLNEIERTARREGYHTISVEATEDKTLGALLVSPLKTLLFDLNRIAGAGKKSSVDWRCFVVLSVL